MYISQLLADEFFELTSRTSHKARICFRFNYQHLEEEQIVVVVAVVVAAVAAAIVAVVVAVVVVFAETCEPTTLRDTVGR